MKKRKVLQQVCNTWDLLWILNLCLNIPEEKIKELFKNLNEIVFSNNNK